MPNKFQSPLSRRLEQVGCLYLGNDPRSHGLTEIRVSPRTLGASRGNTGRLLTSVENQVSHSSHHRRRPESHIIPEGTEQKGCIRGCLGVVRTKAVGVLKVDEDGGRE